MALSDDMLKNIGADNAASDGNVISLDLPPVTVTPKKSLSEDMQSNIDSVRGPVTNESMKSSPLGSNYENFSAGAGKSVVDTYQGVKQIAEMPRAFLEKKFPGLAEWATGHGYKTGAEESKQTQDEIDETKKQDAPLMGTAAGFGGNVAGNIASTMLPFSLAAKGSLAAGMLNPSTYKAATALGAGLGAIQPVSSDDSRLTNTLAGGIGGIAGHGLVNGLGRIAQPINNVLSKAHQKAVQVLENAGIPLSASQKTGSTFLRRISSSFNDNPFTAGAQGDLMTAQKVGYNSAVLKTIGENDTHATGEVMGRAENRINGAFKDILSRNDIDVPQTAIDRLNAIKEEANTNEVKSVGTYVDKIINGANANDGKLSGQNAYQIKKLIDPNASSSDPTIARHSRLLRSELLNIIDDSLNPEDQTGLRLARTQFRNMKLIDGTVDKDGIGDISSSRLANTLHTRANRSASVYGKGDQQLVDLAHSGNMLLHDKLSNSGTAARTVMQNIMPLIAGGGAGFTGGNEDHSYNTQRALSFAAGAYALPSAAQYLINKPGIANYMANGMQGKMNMFRDFLQSPQNNNAVGGAMQRLPEAFNMPNKK